MNVLLLTQFYSSGSTGGGDYVFYLIADMLAKKGHKVWVVTTEIKDINVRQHKNIKFIFPVSEIDRRKKRRFKDNLLYTFRAIKFGLSLNKNEKIDIIHSNTGVPFPALVGSILSFVNSIPHVVTIHLLLTMSPGYWKQFSKEHSKINAILGPFFEKLQIKFKSSAIHTVHESVRDDLIKFGVKKKIYVIHNGVPSPKMQNLQRIPLQFLYIGRLVFYKNVQTAIKAIEIVKKNHPDVKLIIAGNGPYRNNLEKLTIDLNLQKNIIFKGFVDEEEKNKLFESSTSYILPSLSEGFPMSILESFSFSTPVMVSDVRPMSNLIEDKKIGLVIQKNDESEWAQAFEYMLENPNKVKEMGKECKKLFEKKYNLDLMEKRLIEMYNDQISKK